MKKFIFIQARMSSKRLPGKVLMGFRGSNVMRYLYDKCAQIKGINNIVILTSLNEDDNKIEEYCKKNKMAFFRGSLENVLQRFKDAAKFFCNDDDLVIRLCADSPLIDKNLLQDFVSELNIRDQFVSTRVLENCTFTSTTGKGNNIDAMKVSDLHMIDGKNDLIREHIIYGFDFHMKFRLYLPKESLCENGCIDTKSDYVKLAKC
tara:strand:- start:281 stop:895 length:615 start_codon:yes stop_codon:yes gene_type:complete